MKLQNLITVQPPPYTDHTGKIITPNVINTDTLNVTYSDNPTYSRYYVSIEKIPGNIDLFVGEDYIANSPIDISKAEPKLLSLLGDNPSGFLRSLFPKTLEEHPDGPGSILTSMISTLGIKSTSNCACRRHAIEMNEKGNEWCEQNMDTILSWLKEESKKRNLPYVDTVARMMVNKAISKSKKLLSKK